MPRPPAFSVKAGARSLPTPEQFEHAVTRVAQEKVAQSVPRG